VVRVPSTRANGVRPCGVRRVALRTSSTDTPREQGIGAQRTLTAPRHRFGTPDGDLPLAGEREQLVEV
jgi:hypothetical protein